MRVQFCRLNLSATYSDYEEKDQYLKNAFTLNYKIGAKKFIWQIVETREFTEEGFKYYFAQLIKYDPKHKTEIFNKVSNKIEQEDITDKVEEKIFFMLERNSGLIAFQVSTYLPDKIFQSHFKKIIEKSNNNFFINAQFETIPNKSKFKEDLKKIHDIKAVKITLHPSNPSFKPVYQKIDETLKEACIKSIQEKAIPSEDSDGIKLEKYPNFQEKMQMALDGYGNTEIKGYINGELVKIQTMTTPYEKILDKEFIDGENGSNMAKVFINLIKHIKEYIKNDQ